MEKTSLQEYLTEGLRKYGVDQGFVVTDKSIAKLLKGAVKEKLLIKACSQKQITEAIIKCSGKVLEQTEEQRRFITVVGAGVANLNVAFVALEVNDDGIEIEAVAKEGLIKQNTANKAINAIKKQLA